MPTLITISKFKAMSATAIRNLVMAGVVVVTSSGTPVFAASKLSSEPTPEPTPTPQPSSIDLTNWKLTLPVNTSADGDPDEIKVPALHTYASEYLKRLEGKLIFKAHVGGATTSGSGYPRSELREMKNNGVDKADWSNKTGTHTMGITQSIDHTPTKKPHVVAGQIHDADDDVVMVRLEGKNLFVEVDGDDVATLDANYTLGKKFDTKIVATPGKITVYHNGAKAYEFAKTITGGYFKAGCYTQSNTSKGDAPTDYGQVSIYSLKVTHN